jgi:hypothetical protein
MAGRQLGGAGGIPRDHRLGERGMLPQRPAAHFGRVRLGVEAKPDLAADPRGQCYQAGVVRGPGDRLVQRVVRQPGGVPAGGMGVLADGPADGGGVGAGPPLGRGAGDELLDEPPVVQQLDQFVPGRVQGALDHLVGSRTRAGLDERSAATAAPGGHIARGLQPLQRLAHRGPAHLQRGGELPLGGQPLAGDELPERDGGDQALGDPLARRAHRHGDQQGTEVSAARGGRGGYRVPRETVHQA